MNVIQLVIQILMLLQPQHGNHGQNGVVQHQTHQLNVFQNIHLASMKIIEMSTELSKQELGGIVVSKI